MLNKLPLSYILFSTITFFFVLILVVISYIYFNWGNVPSFDNTTAVEVSLPIINWEKYTELSNKIDGND